MVDYAGEYTTRFVPEALNAVNLATQQANDPQARSDGDRQRGRSGRSSRSPMPLTSSAPRSTASPTASAVSPLLPRSRNADDLRPWPVRATPLQDQIGLHPCPGHLVAMVPLDANSRQQGRSRSLGQVSDPVVVGRSRSQPMTLLYSCAVRHYGPVVVGGMGLVSDRKPRIKSLSGARSRGFISVRAAGRAGRVYPGELGCIGVNCNPNCNPGRWTRSDVHALAPSGL